MADEKDNDRKRALAHSFQQRLSTIDTEGERAFITELVDQISTPRCKIPEPVFREIFLPYFMGEKLPDADHTPFAHWIGLVGSASEPADVVNVKGETLFEVPPLYDSSVIDPTKKNAEAHDFATIFSVYQDESKVHPVYGQRYLVDQLTKKASVGLPENNETHHYSWLPALKHYNLVKEENGQTIAAPGSISDDDLSFD